MDAAKAARAFIRDVFFSAQSSAASLSPVCEGNSICDALNHRYVANAAIASEPKLNSVSHRSPALIIFPSVAGQVHRKINLRLRVRGMAHLRHTFGDERAAPGARFR